MEGVHGGDTELALKILLCCAMVKIASRLVSHAQLEQAESFQACFVALRTPCGVNAAEFERLHGDRHARLFVQLQGRWLSPLLLKIICRSYGGSQRSC